ncbi:uncharacterized protein [Nicotiana tomentosiformis]|uniref:uncharacterized protein n=1 Tax=Nicotiana tomentosiformis TaxID=4098 RepID=UPI00388C5A2E
MIRNSVESEIPWKINEAKIAFRLDNWTGQGLLATRMNLEGRLENIMVEDCIMNNNWDMDFINSIVPNYLARVIFKTPIGARNMKDQPVWQLTTSGDFSCSSAWDLLRQKKNEKLQLWKEIWRKDIPFKMSFMLWRLVKRKVPFDEIIINFGQTIVPNYSYCNQPKDETIGHVFITSDLATNIWNFLAGPMGV